MKRRHILILVIGITLGVGVKLFLAPADLPSVSIEAERSSPSRPSPAPATVPARTSKSPMVPIQKSSFEKNLVRTPAKDFVKAGMPDHADNYGFSFTDLPIKRFSLVNNYSATLTNDPKKSTVISGYEVSPTGDTGDLNIIFNKETKKYGVWTREIRLTGDPQLIRAAQEEFRLERAGPGDASVPFKVPEGISLETVLSYLVVAGIAAEIDIKYARFMPQ